MNDQDLRFECLRLAASVSPDGRSALALARDYYRFALLGIDVVAERVDARKENKAA